MTETRIKFTTLLALICCTITTECQILCPTSNEGNLIGVPNSEDGSTFYVCADDGKILTFHCPENYYYSSTRTECLSVLSFGEETTLPSKLEESTLPPDFCPPEASGFVPHPTNCSLIVLCMLGDVTLLECPAGMHFSPTQLKCLPEAEAGCVGTTVPPTETDQPTTEEPTETTTEEPVVPTTEDPVQPTTEDPVQPTTEDPVQSTTENPPESTTSDSKRILLDNLMLYLIILVYTFLVR